MDSSVGMKLGSSKKKMVIKPFKVSPKLPEQFEDETWKKLEAAIQAVQQKQPTSFSREELYRAVEDMCTWKMSARLYEKLKAACAAHINNSVEHLVGLYSDVAGFLERMYQLWSDHCDDMLVIRTIFLYLDRTYVMQTPQVVSIWDMGLQLLRDNIVQRPQLESRLIQGLLELIARERNGEAIGRSYVFNLLRMLLSLQLYHADFEPKFLLASEQYYTQEGVNVLESANVPQFLVHVERRLQEENERVVHYLDVSTRRPLIQVVETKLLQPHTTTLLERGFDALMEEARIEDLKRMYQLFQRVDAVDSLKASFAGYIKKKISALVMDIEQEQQLVDKLLHLKAELDRVLADSFAGNSDFAFAMKSALEYAINVRASRPAELVAKFVDMKLRTGNKGGSEAEVENLLDRVMVIFRYIQGKDVFEAFYKKDLAKRLLLGRSASFDLEKMMLAKLKTECGNSFTNKLEGMFKDIDLSQSVMAQFQQNAASKAEMAKLGTKIDMHVQVLTTGFWPPYPAVEMNVPFSIVPLQQIFEKFYSSKYQGRQLTWQHALSHCIVKAKLPLGRKELVISLYQATVLLCFNGKDTIGFKDIKEQTRIEDGELRRTLQSLACGKERVLMKIPKGKEVEDSDEFTVNNKYSNPKFRVKINSIQLRETKQENEETHERVFRDRQYQVDAAIVRIMKARKTLSHAVLMSEIFGQLRFPAKPADIKRRIESLIDRDYLERDTSNPQVYNYLA